MASPYHSVVLPITHYQVEPVKITLRCHADCIQVTDAGVCEALGEARPGDDRFCEVLAWELVAWAQACTCQPVETGEVGPAFQGI